MINYKRRFWILISLAIISVIMFMLIWLFTYKHLIFGDLSDPNIKRALANIVRRRAIQMIAIVVSVVLITISSLSFQTITENRILTPSILGFDSIFIMTQTLLVFLFGSVSIFLASDYVNFALSVFVMTTVVLLMFAFVFRKNKNNIVLLLLLGLVITSLLGSMTHFLQVFMHPEDFQNVISITNVNINAINENLVFISLPILIILLGLFIKDNKTYDVMSLGESNAINLGVNYQKKTRYTLIYITVATAIATALVGPLSFLGLIAVNGAKELFKTNKHKSLMLLSSLVGIVAVLGGQVILDLVKFKTPVTVIINLIGGVYLLYILIKENKE